MQALVAATGAALCYGAGVALQQEAASRSVGASEGVQARLSTSAFWERLLGRPLWWLGSALNALGYVCQVLALQHGQLATVQVVLLTSVLWGLGVGALLHQRSLGGRELGGCALLVGGLALVLGREVSAVAALPGAIARALAWSCFLLVVAWLPQRLLRSAWADVILAARAGICFGCAALFMKLGAARGQLSGVSMLFAASLLVAGLLTWLGFASLQRAFALGTLARTYTVAMACDPLSAALLGQQVLGERLIVSPTQGLSVLAGGIALLAGLYLLAAVQHEAVAPLTLPGTGERPSAAP